MCRTVTVKVLLTGITDGYVYRLTVKSTVWTPTSSSEFDRKVKVQLLM